MTPTLLAASSAAYLVAPATGSDTSAASVDGSALAGTASEESSDDHRDDVVPSDFAVLLAAMMAPAAPSPVPLRIDLADAVSSSAEASAIGDAAATSASFATRISLPASDAETPALTPTTSEVETLVPAIVPAPATTPASSGASTMDLLDAAGATAGADRTTAQTPTPLEGAQPGRVDVPTASMPVTSSTTERELPAPSVSLVALDRPRSLGRSAPAPSAGAEEVPVAASRSADGLAAASPSADLPASAIGQETAIPTQRAPSVEPAFLPSTVDLSATPAAMPSAPVTVALSVPLTGAVAPRSTDDDALDSTSPDDGGRAMSFETDVPAASTPATVSQNSAVVQSASTRTATMEPAHVGHVAEPTRLSRDEPSTPKDDDAVLSTSGVATGPGHASLSNRPVSVEATAPPVVEGVRPGDTSQHIVRAALRAQAADGTQHMRLEMHPGELGAVAVEVTIEGGAVHVAMLAERGETKDLLRSSIAELRSSLVAAGFSAGRVDIQSGLSDSRFGQAADRHDAWSQSFDRPDSRRDQSGAFANMFDQSSGHGEQARNSRPFSEAVARDSASALRGVRGTDHLMADSAITTNGARRDRLDVQL